MPGSIGGLSDIRTGIKAKIRSMPENPENKYLDLYVMTKRKARLELEKLAVEKREKGLKADLGDLKEGIKRIEKTVQGEAASKRKCRSSGDAAQKKPFKTMDMDY